MKVPYSWLQSFVDAPLPGPERVVELLDGLGLAVEGVEELPGAPDGVVVAEVLEVAAIEGSEQLKRVIVTDGENRHQVVCGAPNVAVGMRTALALPGTVLPGLGAEPVDSREMLGVRSEGVLASPKELGLYEHTAGLISFADDLELGEALSEAWLPETVIELEVTPNRADAFSLLGVARDLCAKLPARLLDPSADLPAGDPSGDDGLELLISDPEGAPRFALRAVRGVTVGPSPVWLQRRLAALGLRPRNNIVDVTNLVTFELGQPSHAYDLATLSGGKLGVRRAREGEELLLLNDESITLDKGDLVITAPDAGSDRPVGLAGIMGGRYGGVEETTTAVALETAFFDPVTIRRAGQRHKLVSDARTRFERGVDPNLQEVASARLAALTVEVAGGKVDPALSAVGQGVERAAVAYRPSRVQFLCDFEVPLVTQERYLSALGCVVVELNDDHWLVEPPSWRFDLTIEEDFVEEVARLHGYEHIGETIPEMHFVPPATDPTHRRLRNQLAALGFLETISYAFTGARELERAAAPTATVELTDPQGVERAVLRTALYPGLLSAAQQNAQAKSLALFEVGRIFGQTEEEERLSLLLRGPRELGTWRAGLPGDFYTFKGVLEQLAGLVGSELTLAPTTAAPYLHPGVAASVSWNGTQVGYAGKLHPKVAAHYQVADCFVAELRLPLAGQRIDFKPIARQQFAERDLAIIAPQAVTFAELHELCATAAGPLLDTLEPFDVYQGAQVPSGSRSVALRFHFLSAERALTDSEVDTLMGNVIQAVRGAGYDIRA